MLDATTSPDDPTPRHCDGLPGSRRGARPCSGDCPSQLHALGGRGRGRRPDGVTATAVLADPPAVCEACGVRHESGACPPDCAVREAGPVTADTRWYKRPDGSLEYEAIIAREG